MKIVYRGFTIALATFILAGWTFPTPVETVLHNFTFGPGDGNYPWAGLIADEEGCCQQF